MVLIEEVN